MPKNTMWGSFFSLSRVVSESVIRKCKILLFRRIMTNLDKVCSSKKKLVLKLCRLFWCAFRASARKPETFTGYNSNKKNQVNYVSRKKTLCFIYLFCFSQQNVFCVQIGFFKLAKILVAIFVVRFLGFAKSGFVPDFYLTALIWTSNSKLLHIKTHSNILILLQKLIALKFF